MMAGLRGETGARGKSEINLENLSLAKKDLRQGGPVIEPRGDEWMGCCGADGWLSVSGCVCCAGINRRLGEGCPTPPPPPPGPHNSNSILITFQLSVDSSAPNQLLLPFSAIFKGY